MNAVQLSPRAREIANKTLARVQAVNRLHEAMRHLSATEIEALASAVRAGTWRE